MSGIQDGASFNPGDEEDFIRQLQAQLAGENADGAAIGGDGSATSSPLGEISASTTADNNENSLSEMFSSTKKNRSVIKNKVTFFTKFMSFVKFFIVPFVFVILFSTGFLFFENMIIKCVLVFALASIFAYYISFICKMEVSDKTATAQSILEEVAKGKLSFNIQDDADLKNALGALAEPIDHVILELSDMVTKFEMSVLDMVGNSDALSYFATSMANKTDQQEASVQKIDQSALSMNESMQNIRQSVESAYENTKTSIVEADNSSVEILSLIKEMNTINEMSEKITATMKLISDIADETNLLALNASIQSAHAGEEGKGFGVVASEIRNLAESSSKATKSIYQTIETTVDSITKGVNASEKAKKALAKIVASIKSTEDIMSNINEAINTQSETTMGLKDSVSNIGELTKNINSDTQNMKAAIANLSGQAQILNTIIKGYEVNQSSIKSDVIFGVE